MTVVLDYLQGRGVVFTVIPRAAEEGVPARVPEEIVAKTVVMIANNAPALLVIPASRAVDMALVIAAVGDPGARQATASELERRFPDYEVGALPPLSMLLLTPMFVDPAVMEREEIVFPAGRHDIAVKMATGDLIGNDPVVVAPLTAESGLTAAGSGNGATP